MEHEEKKAKHLEFIQASISRMNQCSFQIKGWAITVVTALLALYSASIVPETGTGNDLFIYIAIVPTLLFWFLDAYYLQQERKFRGLYNDLIDEVNSKEIKEYEMPLGRYCGCKYCVLHIMWTKTEWVLYLPIILGLIAVGHWL